MVFDMAFHMAFPCWEEIQEQGCGIEFAYARTATLESYSENRRFAIALLKSRTDDTYWLKYYICKWEKSPTRAKDCILLSCNRKASSLAEKANQTYPTHVQRVDGFDGYRCYFYQRRQKIYSWWVACPDGWAEMERVVQELIHEIPYPSPLHEPCFITVSQALSEGI